MNMGLATCKSRVCKLSCES